MDIHALLGARVLGEDQTENYIAWAEHQLNNGDDADNIVTLAGLGLDKIIDREEVLFYFQRYLEDKGIEENSASEEINGYIKYLCQKIISDNSRSASLMARSRMWLKWRKKSPEVAAAAEKIFNGGAVPGW